MANSSWQAPPTRERQSDLFYTTLGTEGRAYRYHPAVEKEAAGKSALSRIREAVYQGSAEMLFAQLVSDRQLKREELERMRRMLNERLKEGS